WEPASRRSVAELLERFPHGYDALLRRRGRVRVVRQANMEAPAPGGDAGPSGETDQPQPELERVSPIRELARSLRLHQCVKNVLVFVPLVLSGRFTVPGEAVDTLLAFIALSLVAAGTYILNDIWDVADDRAHWSKKERPIASGRLSAATALAVAVLLVPGGLALAAFALSWQTCVAL